MSDPNTRAPEPATFTGSRTDGLYRLRTSVRGLLTPGDARCALAAGTVELSDCPASRLAHPEVPSPRMGLKIANGQFFVAGVRILECECLTFRLVKSERSSVCYKRY